MEDVQHFLSQFSIDEVKNQFSQWSIKDVQNLLEQKRTQDDRAFHDLAKYLLFMQHLKGEPITKSGFVDKIHDDVTKVGSAENIYLWTKCLMLYTF